MKLAWVGLAGALAFVGCKQNESPREAQQDVAEARQEANQELTEARQDAAKEHAEVNQDLREKEANARQEVAEEQRDAREAEYQAEGTGGSGTLAQTGTLVGTLASASKDSLKIKDEAGNEHDLKANADTRVMMGGKAVKLENLKEGSGVRAAYSTRGEDKVVSSVTVTAPKAD